jgi:hypothetical protein
MKKRKTFITFSLFLVVEWQLRWRFPASWVQCYSSLFLIQEQSGRVCKFFLIWGIFFFYPNIYPFTPTYFKIFPFYPCFVFLVNCLQNCTPLDDKIFFGVFVPEHFYLHTYRCYRNTFINVHVRYVFIT